MRDHSLALYSIGFVILVVLAIASWIEVRRERREERSFEMAYAKSRLSIDSLEQKLADSEAAAITAQSRYLQNPAAMALEQKLDWMDKTFKKGKQ